MGSLRPPHLYCDEINFVAEFRIFLFQSYYPILFGFDYLLPLLQIRWVMFVSISMRGLKKYQTKKSEYQKVTPTN